MPIEADNLAIEHALSLYESGTPLTAACKEAGTQYSTIIACAKTNADLAGRLLRSHEEHAAALVQQSLEIADTDVDPQRARVRMLARQWAASRIDRKAWGDRVDVQVEQKVSITAALEAAEQRLRLGSDLVLEGTAQVVENTIDRVTRPTDSLSDSDLPDPFE